jgi:hypothetical protein
MKMMILMISKLYKKIETNYFNIKHHYNHKYTMVFVLFLIALALPNLFAIPFGMSKNNNENIEISWQEYIVIYAIYGISFLLIIHYLRIVLTYFRERRYAF